MKVNTVGDVETKNNLNFKNNNFFFRILKMNFKEESYAGISVLFETNSGYFNASRMCSDNGKKWRNHKTTKDWKNKVAALEKRLEMAASDGALIRAASFSAKNVKPEWQGEYVHPKLIHFVAEFVSDDYAFMVADLMESINEHAHKKLEIEHKPITNANVKREVEQTVKTFKSFIDEANKKAQREYERQTCWGSRDMAINERAWGI